MPRKKKCHNLAVPPNWSHYMPPNWPQKIMLIKDRQCVLSRTVSVGGHLKYLRVANILTWVDPVLTFNISGLIPFNLASKKPRTETTAVPRLFLWLLIPKVHATERLSYKLLHKSVFKFYIYFFSQYNTWSKKWTGDKYKLSLSCSQV